MNSLLRTTQLLSLTLLLTGCASHQGEQQHAFGWQPKAGYSQSEALSLYHERSYGVLVSNEAIELMGVDLGQPNFTLNSLIRQRLVAQQTDAQSPTSGGAGFPLIKWRAHWK